MRSDRAAKTVHKTGTECPIVSRVGVSVQLYGTLATRGKELPIGWYKDFGCFGQPLESAGRDVEYVPILLYKSQEDVAGREDVVRQMWDAGEFLSLPGLTVDDVLDAGTLSRLKKRIKRDADRFPKGTLFLVGNEPGYSGMGNGRTPEEIVHDAKLLKTLLYDLDRGYRLGLGGISTARCKYTKQAYRGVYGIDFFKRILQACGESQFDAFVIHPYPDPLSPSCPSFEDSRDQIIEFRQVLAEHGLRDKELLVGEIGVPFPGLKEEDKSTFAKDLVEFMLTQTDGRIGNPSDHNLLVQRFCWFSLTPPDVSIPGLTDNPRLDFKASALVDVHGELTALGKVFFKTVDRVSRKWQH